LPGALPAREGVQPSSFGIGAEPGRRERRKPRAIVPTEGKRATVLRSIALLVPQPGQKT
jgi:hypothetical protein